MALHLDRFPDVVASPVKPVTAKLRRLFAADVVTAGADHARTHRFGDRSVVCVDVTDLLDPAAKGKLSRTLRLFAGPLCVESDGEWVEAVLEEVRAAVVAAVLRVARAARAAGDLRGGVGLRPLPAGGHVGRGGPEELVRAARSLGDHVLFGWCEAGRRAAFL